jgi:hypothetical protein
MIVLTDHSPIELIRRWIALDIPSLAEHEIKLINLSAIGRVDIAESEDLAIFLNLLESLGRMEIIFFRFDNSEIDSVVLQEIVCKFLLAFATDKFATIRESILTDNIGFIPAMRLEYRIDVFCSGVGFGVGHDDLINWRNYTVFIQKRNENKIILHRKNPRSSGILSIRVNTWIGTLYPLGWTVVSAVGARVAVLIASAKWLTTITVRIPLIVITAFASARCIWD